MPSSQRPKAKPKPKTTTNPHPVVQDPRAQRFNALMNGLIGSFNGQTYNSPTEIGRTTNVQSRVRASHQANEIAQYDKTNKAIAAQALRGYEQNQADGGVTSPNIELLSGEELTKSMDDLIGGDKSDGGGWFDDVKNVGGNILGRVGDVASRPLYAVYNGYIESKEAANAREGVDPNGSDGGVHFNAPEWADVTNFASGALKGLTGAKDEDPEKSNKSTPGEAIELFDKPFFNYHREHNTPVIGSKGVQQNINRAVGFGGEVWGDPANLVGGKALGVLRHGEDLGTAARAVEGAAEVAEDVKKGRSLRNLLPARRATAAVGKDINYDKLEEVYQGVMKNVYDEVPELTNRRLAGGLAHPRTGLLRGGARNVSDEVAKEMAQQADDALLTANGRAVGARHGLFKNAVITRGVQSVRDNLLKDFDRAMAGNMPSPAKYARLVADDPIWKAYDEALQVALKTDPTDARAIAEAAARSSMDDVLEKVGKSIEKQLDGTMYNTFAIRIGNKQIPIKALGKGYAAIQDKIPFHAPNAFSYANQLPGLTGQVVGNARRFGHENFEGRFLNGFTEDVVDEATGQTVKKVTRGAKEVARQYTKEERRQIMRHIHNETNPGGKLQEGVDFIRDAYKRIAGEEVEAGVRSATDTVPSNYQYLHVPPRIGPGSTRKIKEFEAIKAARGDEAEKLGKFLLSPEEISKQGFKASDDPFESLAHRQLKSERLKSRSQVTESFFRTYGLSSKTLTNKQAVEQGLTKMAGPGMVNDVASEAGYKLNRTLSNYIEHTGESLYLPNDVADAYKNYIKLADVGSAKSGELAGYLRAYDRALNFFKMSATVPFPGFHVKNMAGDVFVGYMDGVKAMDYTRFINANKTGKFKLARSGVELTAEDFDNLFAKYGKSGGFVESELFPSAKFGEGGPKGFARNVGQKAKDLSGRREDLGREVHFMKALDEELANKGIKSFDGKVAESKLFKKAVDDTTYRINKYKFDYGALTATEKNVMRRTIPFYTFLRKSAPLMLEGMLMNPSQFGKSHRFFDDAESLGPRAAQWQREIGFANPFGGKEPLLLPQNILPTDAITTWGKNPLNPGSFFDNALNSAAPPIKAAVELGTGRSAFTGQELFNGESPSLLQQGKYLADNMAPILPALEEQVVQPGLQAAGLRDNSGSTAPNPTKDLGEFLLGSRFALGLGARRLTTEDQRKNVNSELGKLQGKLDKFSLQLKPYGIKVFLSRTPAGNSIKVRSLDGKKTLYSGNMDGALEVIKQYTGNPGNVVKPEDEQVQYVDTANQRVSTGRRGDVNPLDRILTQG